MRALEDRPPEQTSDPIFPVKTVYVGGLLYLVIGTLIVVDWELRHTALIDPVDPLFRAIMSSVGAFTGVGFAAIVRDGWTLGIGLFEPVPKKIYGAVQLVALVGASYFAGGYVADGWTEWRAFYGVQPASRKEAFFVNKYNWHSRGAPSTLDLSNANGSLRFTIDCGLTSCRGVRSQSWIMVDIQTGRGGVQRASLPPYSKTVRPPVLSTSRMSDAPS